MTALLLILALFSAPAGGAKRVSDREREGFVGPVKEVFVEWSPAARTRSGIEPDTRCPSRGLVFDEGGRLLQRSAYAGSCGCEELRDVYTYAEDGSMTTKYERFPAPGCPPPPPPMAAPVGELEFGPRRRVFAYDEHGRRTEDALVRANGKLVYKTVYNYDARGRLAETTSVDEDGSAGDRRVNVYAGESRFPSELKYYTRDGRLSSRTVYSDYELNAQGDWVKRTQTSSEGDRPAEVSSTFRRITYFDR